MLPLTAFNKLRAGIDWVLEKLGVINKASGDLDKTAEKADAAKNGAMQNPAISNGAYIPATSTFGVYQAYQPVTAPGAGNAYTDNRQSHYNITLQSGGAPGGELGNQLRDAVERADREKRARERADMRTDG